MESSGIHQLNAKCSMYQQINFEKYTFDISPSSPTHQRVEHQWKDTKELCYDDIH